MPKEIPVALTIAGSDCCAGAGLQADLKTFGSLSVHGLTVVTAVVAETPLEVAEIHLIPPALIQSQLALLLATYPVAAMKTGMLGSKAQIVAVAELLGENAIPLVVDPVMIASSGDRLLPVEAAGVLAERLIPRATLITPNFPEAIALLGSGEDISPKDLVEGLAEKFGCSVLLTGGHGPTGSKAMDLLWHEGVLHEYRGDWIELPVTHGTGCTLSAAITAGLAKGMELPAAVQLGKEFVTDALLNAHRWADRDLVALAQCGSGPGEEG